MKQFKLVVSTCVSVSLLSLPIFVQASTPEPYNWSGFYAGLNAGAVKHTLSMTDNQATTFYSTIQEISNLKFTGGFQAGYRRQLNLTQVSSVYGLEFSANFSEVKFNKDYGSPFALYQLNANNELKNVDLLELIGGIAADRTLLFFAAGLSWTNVKGSTTNIDGIPFFDSFSVSKKTIGAAIGAGIEYAFNEKFSARFKVDYIMPNAYSTTDNIGDQFQISNDITQGSIGVNYKFG